MLKMFSGGGGDESWPLSKIVSALKSQYGTADALGEDGPLKVYGVQENGVNFVVALVQSAPKSGKVVELGFLARFVGFPADARTIEGLNRNLNISFVSLEGADLFLMAGLQVTGAFDQKQFSLIMDAWRGDLMVTVQGLSGDQSSMTAAMSAAFPVTKLAAARDFAANRAPTPELAGDQPIDVLSSFLGAKAATHVFCGECNGRGKRGFITRSCDECEGVGFVKQAAR